MSNANLSRMTMPKYSMTGTEPSNFYSKQENRYFSITDSDLSSGYQFGSEKCTLPPLDFNCKKPTKLPSITEILERISKMPVVAKRNPISIKLPSNSDTMSLTPSPTQTYSQSGFLPPSSSQPFPMKRPRRLHHQVTRIYSCDYMGCKKSYGALNHLNSHILSQGHGHKRRAYEFYHLTRP